MAGCQASRIPLIWRVDLDAAEAIMAGDTMAEEAAAGQEKAVDSVSAVS